MSRHLLVLVACAWCALIAAVAASPAQATTVFYSGNNGEGVGYAEDYVDIALDLKTWKGKDCSTENILPDTGGKPITRLGGWSRGRLGPIYYLHRFRKNDKRLDALRSIILYDPGSYGEFTGKDQCDLGYDVDGLLASWLARNRDNRLLILAGKSSFDQESGMLFKGIRSVYMTSSLGIPSLAATRATTCVVEKNGFPFSHSDTLKTYAKLMDDTKLGCPDGFYSFAPGSVPYANRIVKASNDKITAFVVGADGKSRQWIADGGTYQCIERRTGREFALMPSVLALMPLVAGNASCPTTSPAVPPPTDIGNGGGTPPPGNGGAGTPSVTVAQGPAAPAGYRYAITLAGFAPGTSVSVSCRDSTDPGGFFNFTMAVDAAGNGFTQTQCYSGDGPDHWVIANGVESNHATWGGATTPPPPPTPPPPRTWAEQQGSRGANTFTNPYNASGMGVKVAPYQWVDIACKVYAPQIQSANPDGYWYRIASSPWNNGYYAVANTFWNGDVPGRLPYTHNTDWAVPNC